MSVDACKSAAHPSVISIPWLINVGVGGTFTGIYRHLDDLIVQGPPRGYLLEPIKNILVVSPRNVPWAEAFFWGYRLKIVTGSSNLGVFVGTEAAQD